MFTPAAWGTRPDFFKLLPPNYACKFQCLLTRKIHNFRTDFFIFCVKKINFLIDYIGLPDQNKSSIQEEIRPFTNNCLYESKLHQSWWYMVYPPTKFLPPSLVYPPAFLRFFLPPQLCKFQKFYPSAKVGGRGANYGERGFHQSTRISWHMWHKL